MPGLVSETQVLRIDAGQVDQLLEKEWLLSNRRGSYASGTVIGCNTRRYHGLLVASLRAPVGRVVTVSNLLEIVEVGPTSYELASFEFSDRLHPTGYRYLRSFWQDAGVHFLYEIGGLQITKSIYLAGDDNLAVVCYDFGGHADRGCFRIKPLVGLRDFHSLQSSSTTLHVDRDGDVVTVVSQDPAGPAVHMRCVGARFDGCADWWHAMHYRQEARRGQDDYEDVWAPGNFELPLVCPGRIVLAICATPRLQRPRRLDIDVDEFARQLNDRMERLYVLAEAKDDDEKMLVRAADQFVVRRRMNEARDSATILGGYHWFADWGRDAFISLCGLLLCTGRGAEAREVLLTFGDTIDQGMIPNCFDDYGGQPHYNSVDASLWFINAAYQYLLATPDRQTFDERLAPAMAQIVAAYEGGTRFGIHAEPDGLISAGDAESQLTWMDARCDGVSFTPRYGKAVEVNALWINALNIMAATTTDAERRRLYMEKAGKASQSFVEVFWNEPNECLNDWVGPDGRADATIRPNQIFAVSLPFSCLDRSRQAAVVKTVQHKLLTPYGLRTLPKEDRRYKGHYHGSRFERDSAYHQGTVWAYLIGPFVESFLKVNDHSRRAVEQARKMLEPLMRHLRNDACLQSVSEIFDGDEPHEPKGCVAQAWSVAELLRAKKLLAK